MRLWIKALLSNLDNSVDPRAREKIMGACGETCPFTHLNDEKLLSIKKGAVNDTDFLNQLCDQWRVVHENDQYYVVFDQCYCPLVNEDLKGVSKTLCYCTLGNLKRKFRIGLEQPVEVVMLKTILAGDEECRFLIKLLNT